MLINVLSHTLLPDSQQSEDLTQDSMASVAKAPLSSKSDMFHCLSKVSMKGKCSGEGWSGSTVIGPLIGPDESLDRLSCPCCSGQCAISLAHKSGLKSWDLTSTSARKQWVIVGFSQSLLHFRQTFRSVYACLRSSFMCLLKDE